MSRPPEFKNKAIILGVIIDDQPMDFVLKTIEQFLCSDGQRKVFTPNPEICLKAEADENYRHILNSADLNLPDGFGLKLGAVILGEKLENRVSGSDLTPKLLGIANAKNLKAYVIIRTDSLSKEKDIKALISEKYPRIKTKTGEIDIKNIDSCDNALNAINSFQPQILFVCLGAPYQEIWINKYLKLIPSVKVALGIGGSFDFLTGKIKRAPQLMRDLGVEWFYRLYQEPKRLSRVKNATANFLLTCHKWKKRMQNEFRANILSVIKNRENKFLIQKSKRFRNHWQFPQGGIDAGETPEEASLREISEELGVSPKLFRIIKKIPETNQYVWPPHAKLLRGYNGQSQTSLLLEYTGKDADFNLKNSTEVEAIKWVSKESILETLHPMRREFAKKIIPHI